MKSNIESIVENVLILNGISSYDKQDLALQLQIHPNYPSFNSITDTLDYFNIDNIAVEVPKEALDQLPKSFISLVATDQGDDLVSVELKGANILLKYPDQTKEKISKSDFITRWNPKVIAVEDTGEVLGSQSSKVFSNVLITLFGIGAIVLLFQSNWTIPSLSYLGLSLIGVIFGYFAVRESLGFQSQTMHQFCTSVGNTNCGEVINSNKGKLFKDFGIADASLLFFGGLTLYQLFFGFTQTLLLPSVLSIPMILYALYSQAFNIKKWCAICLTISGISLALSAIGISSLSYSISVVETTQFAALFALLTLGYVHFKEKLIANKKYKSDTISLTRFKRDGQLFQHLYNQSEILQDNTPITNEIIIGNPRASFNLISLTNPMCGYCKSAFEAYSRLIKSAGDSLQIRIRLSVNVDELDQPATQISLRLLEIYHQKGQHAFMNAYQDWFNDRTFNIWIKNYGKPDDTSPYLAVLKKQYQWAQDNNVMYTPATAINGRFYPKKYSYDELYHFTSILIDSYQNPIVQEIALETTHL